MTKNNQSALEKSAPLPKPKRVLVVDDSPEIHIAVHDVLDSQYEVVSSESVKRTCELLLSESFDCIILDVVLDDGTGMELCEKIRAMPQYADVPVLFLSGVTQVEARIAGFSLGADDYLVKPFHGGELLARVRALLKRSNSQRTITIGPLHFDVAFQRLSIESGDRLLPVDLTPVEFRMLMMLAKSSPNPVPRDEILKNLWLPGIKVVPENVYIHVYHLRNKLEKFGVVINSKRHEGYVLLLT